MDGTSVLLHAKVDEAERQKRQKTPIYGFLRTFGDQPGSREFWGIPSTISDRAPEIPICESHRPNSSLYASLSDPQ